MSRVVTALREHGLATMLDAPAITGGGFTPLMTAAVLASESDSVAIIRILIGAGAVVGTRDDDGKTALHWAAMVGGAARIRELCSSGAAINARCLKLGETPLHAACRAGRVDAIATLLSHGADPCAQSRAPALLTPLEVAGFPAPAAPSALSGPPVAAALRSAATGALYSGVPRLRTAVVTHPDCLLHANRPGHQVRACVDDSLFSPVLLAFVDPTGQEAPERVTAIMSRILDPTLFASLELSLLPPEEVPVATDAQLLAVHSPDYLALVKVRLTMSEGVITTYHEAPVFLNCRC